MNHSKWYKWYDVFFGIGTLLILILLTSPKLKPLELNWYLYTNEKIADAIWYSEGGLRAKVPYGILSVPVKDEEEARRICLNTIRNNRVRFNNQNKEKDFIKYLGMRYAPYDSKQWSRNVKYFLRKNE
jgi:hypothetical protein